MSSPLSNYCMEKEEIIEYVQTSKRMGSAEQEMSINFVKTQEKASVYTTIASQVKRFIKHSDIIVEQIFIHNEEKKTWSKITPDDFEVEEGDVVYGAKGKVPIESLKIQSSPRSTRSYSQIISPQTEVNL